MNYIGSKHSLLNFLVESIVKVTGNDNDMVFCDIFAGTGSVGIHFKKLGYKIISNDLQYYSYVLNKHYIENHSELSFDKLIAELPELSNADIPDKKNAVCNYLNNIEGYEGFVFNNYCKNGDRLYFTEDNGKKCDAIRNKLDEWKKDNKISENEYYFLLATLIECIDKHANTTSVYGAFLKQIKRSASTTFNYRALPLFVNENIHQIFNEDANELVKKIKSDILYLDPPYNARQYSSNYHVLETIAKNDNPAIKGKTGLRNTDNQKSKYCSKRTVKQEFKKLIENADTKYIFLSYNNEGLLSLEDIKEVMSSRGEYGFFTKEYNRYKADSNRDYSANRTVEYLHYVVIA